MNAGHPISILMFATLIAAVVIAILMLMRFRAKNGAHPMAGQRERNADEIRNEGPRPR